MLCRNGDKCVDRGHRYGHAAKQFTGPFTPSPDACAAFGVDVVLARPSDGEHSTEAGVVISPMRKRSPALPQSQ
jgi:hypothetical protein